MLLALLLVPLKLLRLTVDFLTDLIYSAIYEASGREEAGAVPPLSDVLLLDSATSLAAKIREKKVR